MSSLSTTLNRHKWTLLLVVGVLLIPTHAVFAQSAIAGFLYEYLVIGFFGWLVGLTGVILNYAVNIYVIGFGIEFAGDIGTVVDNTWSTIRDIFNLTFIFGLVYIGFKMILRSDDGNTRRWLINLILAALLVNFSLFITKFVVDFTNILAVEIINLGVADGIFLPATDDTTGAGTVLDNSIDLSGSMVNMMNLTSIVNSDGSAVAATPRNPGFSFVFGTLMVFLVAMFVFISAGVLLIIRAAVLIILMILSPFLFLGMVLPTFSNFSRNLWNRLFTRAFMAPIYIALLYITMSIANEVSRGNLSTAVAGSSGDGAAIAAAAAGTFGPFILIVVLLMSSLVAAQKLGAEGASTVMRIGNNIRQRGQRAVARGAGGMAARRVNWASEKAARGYDRMGSSRIGRGLQTTAAVASLGALSKKNVRGALQAGQQASVAGSETRNQVQARKRAETQASSTLKREAERRKDAKKGTTSEQAAAVSQMSQEELARMSKKQMQESARFLTDSQLSAMESEGRKPATEVDALRKKREDQIFGDFSETFNSVESSAVQLENAFSGIAKAVESIPDNRLAQQGDRLTDQNFARNLSKDQMDVLRQNLDEPAYNAVKSAREAGQISYAKNGLAPGTTNTSVAAAGLAEKNRQRLFQNAQKAGELPPDVFKDPANKDMITTRAIEERTKNGLSEDDKVKISENIQSYIDDPSVEQNVRDRRSKTWKQWSEKSQNYELQLNFKNTGNTGGGAQPNTSPGGIVLDGNVGSAREYRDSTSQDDILGRNT